jgi:Holliday junction DNA helicase RuvA
VYDFFRGKVASLAPARLVLEIGGIGYLFEIPMSTYDVLPRKGDALVFAHFHVREDAQKLYGFATTAERDLFNLLQRVSGIGPTLALNILSRAPLADICAAIAGEDTVFLKSLKGVGPKTAQRLVTELKDEVTTISAGHGTAAGEKLPSLGEDAVLALQVLGYAPKAAQAAVQKVLEDRPLTNVGDLVRSALKIL